MPAGHYVANVFNPTKKSWTKFNDSLVSSMSEEAILQEASKGTYMLFYAHRSLFD